MQKTAITPITQAILGNNAYASRVELAILWEEPDTAIPITNRNIITNTIKTVPKICSTNFI